MSTTILEQIEHLKFHELYDGPINTKLKAILENSESKNNMEEIIDAILHTRNIRQGRGLSHLTYSYLFTLQQVFPAKAVFAIYMIVDGNIGSWRDVRSYCEFVAEHSEKGRADPIIKPIIGLYNHQLIKDVAAWKNALATETSPHARNHISYAVRWIPRPRKGRAWLFHILVVMWVYKDPEYKAIVNSIEDAADAERTCKIMYRKMISDLNKELDRA